MEIFPNGSADPSWFTPATSQGPASMPPARVVDPSIPANADDQLRVDPDIQRQHITLGTEYDPELLNGWRSSANNGELGPWVQAQEELQIAGISGPLGKFRALVQGADYTLVRRPEDDGDEETRVPAYVQNMAKEVLAYVEEDILPHLPDFYSGTLTDGEFFGHSAAIAHDEARGYQGKLPGLKDIEQVPSRIFGYSTQIKDFRVLVDPTAQTWLPVTPLQQSGRMLFYEVNRGRPLSQRGWGWQLVPLACIWQYVLRYWAEATELHGTPLLVSHFQDNDRRAEMVAIKAVRALAHNYRIAVPKSVDLEVITSQDAVRGQLGGAHQQLISWVTQEMSRLILGHDAASGDKTGTGSRTGSVKASEDTDSMVNSVLRRFSRFTRAQLIAPRVRRAFGQKAFEMCVPGLTVRARQTPDWLVESQVILNLAKAGFHILPSQAGKRVDYTFAEDGKNYVGKAEAEELAKQAEDAAKAKESAPFGGAPAAKHPTISRFAGGDKVGQK